MTLKEIRQRLTEIDDALRRLPKKERHQIAVLNREREALLTRIKKNFSHEPR